LLVQGLLLLVERGDLSSTARVLSLNLLIFMHFNLEGSLLKLARGSSLIELLGISEALGSVFKYQVAYFLRGCAHHLS
jgi:hypothetical protein